MSQCLHCHRAIIPAGDLMPGLCQYCTDRHEEIAKVGFEVTIAEARKILAGTLPARVKKQLAQMVKFYEET